MIPNGSSRAGATPRSGDQVSFLRGVDPVVFVTRTTQHLNPARGRGGGEMLERSACPERHRSADRTTVASPTHSTTSYGSSKVRAYSRTHKVSVLPCGNTFDDYCDWELPLFATKFTTQLLDEAEESCLLTGELRWGVPHGEKILTTRRMTRECERQVQLSLHRALLSGLR